MAKAMIVHMAAFHPGVFTPAEFGRSVRIRGGEETVPLVTAFEYLEDERIWDVVGCTPDGRVVMRSRES